jgi:hypothetical protein
MSPWDKAAAFERAAHGAAAVRARALEEAALEVAVLERALVALSEALVAMKGKAQLHAVTVDPVIGGASPVDAVDAELSAGGSVATPKPTLAINHAPCGMEMKHPRQLWELASRADAICTRLLQLYPDTYNHPNLWFHRGVLWFNAALAASTGSTAPTESRPLFVAAGGGNSARGVVLDDAVHQELLDKAEDGRDGASALALDIAVQCFLACMRGLPVEDTLMRAKYLPPTLHRPLLDPA